MTTSAQMLNGPAHTLSTQLLSDLRDLKGLTAEWSDLCARCPDATPFQRPEWLLPWVEVFLRRDCFAITVRDGQRLIGLALLLIYRRDGKSILAFAGGGHIGLSRLLFNQGREAEVVESVLCFVPSRAAVGPSGTYRPACRFAYPRTAYFKVRFASTIQFRACPFRRRTNNYCAFFQSVSVQTCATLLRGCGVPAAVASRASHRNA